MINNFYYPSQNSGNSTCKSSLHKNQRKSSLISSVFEETYDSKQNFEMSTQQSSKINYSKDYSFGNNNHPICSLKQSSIKESNLANVSQQMFLIRKSNIFSRPSAYMPKDLSSNQQVTKGFLEEDDTKSIKETEISVQKKNEFHLFISNIYNSTKDRQGNNIFKPRKTALFQLGQLINDDKKINSRRISNQSTDFSSQSLALSQKALLLPKNSSFLIQNSSLRQSHLVTENNSEIKSPLFFQSNIPHNNFSACTSPLNQAQNLLNKRKNSLISSKLQTEPSSPLKHIIQQKNVGQKTLMPQFEKIKVKRRINERKIMKDFDLRAKTFTKFGFKMAEKEEYQFLKPFFKELSFNEPKGTMFVADLWSNSNIQKFLGSSNMIRDKLTLAKVARKQKGKLQLVADSLKSEMGMGMDSIKMTISQLMKFKQRGQSSSKKNEEEEEDEENNSNISNEEKDDFFNDKKVIEQNIINDFYLRLKKEKDSSSIQTQNSTSEGNNSPISQAGFLANTSFKSHTQIKSRGHVKHNSMGAHRQQDFVLDTSKDNKTNKSNQILLSSERRFQHENKNTSPDLKKVQGWIKQLDQVSQDNDKTYYFLNARIGKLQDAILKCRDFNSNSKS